MSKEIVKKRRFSKTSPLTLNYITKGPKNRNRGKQVQAVRREEEQVEIQQPQPEDEAQELPQGQRSVSPVVTFSLEVRQDKPNQSRVKAHKPLNSSATVLTLLQTMR